MLRTLFATSAAMTLAMTIAPSLHAQSPADTRKTNTPPPAPAPAPAARPRVAHAASPTPVPAQTAGPVIVIPPTYYVQDGGYYMPNGGYIITGAPYVVLQDGSIAANFGNGYERVLRSCATQGGVSPTDMNSTGRDALGRILPPPGIAAIQAGSRGQLGGTMPARNVAACYRPDASGKIEVVQGR